MDNPKSGGKQKQPKKAGGGKEGGSGGKKSSESKGSKPQEQKSSNRDQEKKPLQAFLLADSFLEPPRFRPFTLECPKVLLPLVNVPMLEYTLELLARNGVQDIIIFATSHADQVVNYMNRTRWFHREPELKVTVMVSTQCRSVGDALRHVHESGRIVGDFVLVYGDVVSNLDFRPAIASHKTRAASDTSVAMTLVMTPIPPSHSVRALDDDLVVGTDALTGELVHYSNNPEESSIDINPETFISRRAIRMRHDLMDSGIAICSPMLLLSFTDNFDKTDPRTDYLTQVLHRDDSDVLNEDRVFVHVIESGYAARVSDLYTYKTVSRDIIHRWVFPLLPDSNLLSETSYRLFPGFVYRDVDVDVRRSATIGKGCVLGSDVLIEDDAKVIESVIGVGCVIGQGAVVSQSFLWSNVTVEEGVVIEEAIIGENVVIKKGAKIQRGSVIANNVMVGEGHVVSGYVPLTTLPGPTEDEKETVELLEEEEEEYNDMAKKYTSLLPSSSLSSLPLVSSSPTSTSTTTIQATTSPTASSSTSPSSSLSSSSLYSLEPKQLLSLPSSTAVGRGGKGRAYLLPPHPVYGRNIAFVNTIAPTQGALSLRYRPEASPDAYMDDENDNDLDEPEEDPMEKFFREVYATIFRGHSERFAVENVVLELSGLRFASNVNLMAFSCAVVVAWFRLAGFPLPQLGPASPIVEDDKIDNHNRTPSVDRVPSVVPPAFSLATGLKAFETILKHWSLALSKQAKAETDQIRFILPGVLHACTMHPLYQKALPIVIKCLYEAEVVTPQAIVDFHTQQVETLTKLAKIEENDDELGESKDDHDDDDDDDDDDDEDDENEDAPPEIVVLRPGQRLGLLTSAHLKQFVEYLAEDDEDEDEDEDEGEEEDGDDE